MKRLLPALLSICAYALNAQDDTIPSSVANALTFRMIGPATTSGRIVDLAVNPRNHAEYYIAAAYGGVWKTTNAGTTYAPIFDGHGTQSIGCLALDPINPNTLWVGTGENNNQRSVGYGNGIYRSMDAGKTFTNMGLKTSEHIGMIRIDPRNSNNIYVAAYGPVWKEGGERGLYQSKDGGATWKQIHQVSENTGCNEVHFDPANPDIIYAAYHQRRRHEWTYLGGGPESAIYKSMDGGATWRKLAGGLPTGDIGRIALALSKDDPDRVYAIIEASETSKGIYVSRDKGESWEKANPFATAGNYYQEIFADPHDADQLFIMDTYLKWSKDGGKTVSNVGEKNKHVDNHVIWIDPETSTHWLVGCDGGLYETWDNGANWHYKDNLPLTQFYRVAVDNALPFYNIYGGTQDNNTLGGPSQNASANGIPNSDWFITVGGDGFKSQVDPNNPDIVYSQWQYGGLIRYDRKTGEIVDIRPVPTAGEAAPRFNWDAPLLISHHDPKRLYFASNYLYRSDDRGNSWRTISPDLSRNMDRNKLAIMGKVWSMDAVAKNQSTSIYGNITFASESELDPNLITVGTDDGLIQITRDGGKTWEKQQKFPAPDMSLVSAVLHSQHKTNTLYASWDNHRKGDFKPYVARSSDGGKTWTSIVSNLPAGGAVNAIAEDHVNPSLLFVGTEYGFFASANGGKNWTKVMGGLPPISIKDIAIQERENDLVLATFGRGFAVLDNYSLLRDFSGKLLQETAYIFPVKKAAIYIPRTPLGGDGNGSKGGNYYQAPNPYAGATIYYNLKNEYRTLAEQRRDREKDLIKANKPVNYPTMDSIRLEKHEEETYLLFSIRDKFGREVRRLKAPAKKGMQKLEWDLKQGWVSSLKSADGNQAGPFVAPGTYTIRMNLVRNGIMEEIGNAREIQTGVLFNSSLPPASQAYSDSVFALSSVLMANVSAASDYMEEMKRNIDLASKAIYTAGLSPEFQSKLVELKKQWTQLNLELNGDADLAALEIETLPGINGRLEGLIWGLTYSTTGPTATHLQSFNYSNALYSQWKTRAQAMDKLYGELMDLMDKHHVPYTPGRKFFLKP